MAMLARRQTQRAVHVTDLQGNGLISLAHQLIAAKLNVARGASPNQDVSDAIAAADALIGTLIVPPTTGSDASSYLDPASVNSAEGTLDAFNNGLTSGAAHCGDEPK